MVKKGFKQRAKGLLGVLGLASALNLGSVESAGADNLRVYTLGDGVIMGESYMSQRHSSNTNDTLWSDAILPSFDKWLKVSTAPYGLELQSDSRDLNNEDIFEARLSVVDKSSGNVSSVNSLQFYPSTPGYLDTNRFYTAKIHCDTNYTPNHVSFDKTVNIRDVIANDGGIVGLPGITNVPNGTVYGTVEVNPQFNRVVSTKTGNGTNSLDNVIVNYNSNTNVVLNAANDYYVQQYFLTRTDTTGNVSVVTNNFSGQTVTSTNVPFNNIMGSNAVHAVYAPKITTNGIPYTWLTQYGITNKSDSVETQDGDGDKVTTLDEYFADTNPTNQNSYFQVGSLASGNEIVLGINPSSTGRVYGIDYKTNLMDSAWNPVITNVVGNGSNLNFNLNMDADRKFYRANVGLRE